jgi:hypothetical protein
MLWSSHRADLTVLTRRIGQARGDGWQCAICECAGYARRPRQAFYAHCKTKHHQRASAKWRRSMNWTASE